MSHPPEPAPFGASMLRSLLEGAVARAALALAPEGVELPALVLEAPPRADLGDYAVALFPLARILKQAPPRLASLLASALLADPSASSLLARAEAAGPYVNLTLRRERWFGEVLTEVLGKGDSFGTSPAFAGRKAMVEFSSPNTNKPQHLGHVRNNVIGDSVSRILSACGWEVVKANLVNDRGIHICKSMVAYQHWGEGQTPESTGIKGDHFVGRYYVQFERAHKAEVAREQQNILDSGEVRDAEKATALATDRSPLLEEARKLLRLWEAGDQEVHTLWRRMNDWVLEGFAHTYATMGISFDRFYYESETYQLGRDIVLDGVSRGLCQQRADGSVWVDLTEQGLGEKLLIRRDGTTVYMTQDLGTACLKQEDYRLDRSIYVVASEQDHHFRILFATLKKLGFAWADHLHHLSYGMVYLPEGRMKTREGTVIDADVLMAEMVAQVEELVRERARETNRDEEGGPSGGVANQALEALAIAEEIARPVGLGALKFYLLRFNPRSDVTFNPAESVSLQGDTGPYVQYTATRIPAILERARATGLDEGEADLSLLGNPEEVALVGGLARYPEVVLEAGDKLNPSVIAGFLLEFSRNFNKFYKMHRVVGAESEALGRARLRLCLACGQVLRNGLNLLGMEMPARM